MARETRHRFVVCAARLAAVVLVVAANLFLTAAPAKADSIRDRQWELDFLNTAEAHRISRGEGVTVAVVDSGVDGNHPDLRGNVLPGHDLTDLASGNGWNDRNGHGTGMASLIAGHGHGPGGHDGILGIAPAAKILPVKDSEGEGGFNGYGTGRDMAKAINWAVEHGAKVINLSVGLVSVQEVELHQAVTDAIKADVVVVASAGNRSANDTRVTLPASYQGVVAVGGTDRNGEHIADSLTGGEVVIAAPAEKIMSADPASETGYSPGTGTSNSAAIVSGVAALIRAKYPDLNAASVIQRLITTADDKGPTGRDDQYGFGVVNPVKALTADVATVAHNPLLPSPAPSGTPAEGKSGWRPSGRLLVGLALGLLAMMVILGARLVRQQRDRR